MYTIHARCTINVQDDSGGNVYICAFQEDLGIADIATNAANVALVTDYIRANKHSNSAIISLSFSGGASNVLTGNIYHVVSNLSSNSIKLANIDESYSVYALAIDKYNNVSDLKGGTRGNIPQQAAPLTRNERYAVMNLDDNIAFYGNIYTTVPYEYNTVSFTTSYATANVITFINDYLSDNHISVNQEIIAFDTRFTNRFYNDVVSNTDFDPFLDTTRDHYAYLYMKNDPPHNINRSIEEHQVTQTNNPRGDITLSDPVHERLRDVLANVSFTVGNVENTEYFFAVYNNPVLSPGTNGPLKEHLITHGTQGTPTTAVVSLTVSQYFYDEQDISAKNLENAQTYYMVVLLRDTQTGEHTRTPEVFSFVTGAPPVVEASSNEYLRAFDHVRVTATVEEENVAGPNVYAIAFGENGTVLHVDPPIAFTNLVTYANVLTFVDGSWNSVLGSQEATTQLTGYYANVDTLNTHIPFVPNKNYYIHLLLEDPLNNRDTVAPTTYNGLIAFESQFETTNLMRANVNGVDVDPVWLSDTTTLYEAAGSSSVTFTFSFAKEHKIVLSQMFLDLSNVACSNVSSVTVSPQGILGQSTNLEKGYVHTLNLDTSGALSVTAVSLFTITLSTTVGTDLVIQGLRFRGTVYDDRAPVVSDTVTYSNSNVSFSIEDYNNVHTKVFRSNYYWADSDEQDLLFGGIVAQTFTGPFYDPTPVTFTLAENVLHVQSHDTAIVDNTTLPENALYIYVDTIDQQGNRAVPKVFSNTTGAIASPVTVSTPVSQINQDVTIGFYNETTNRTEIHVEGNVFDSSNPVKYIVDVYDVSDTYTNVRSSININAYEWSDYSFNINTVRDIVANIDKTTQNSIIVEEKSYFVNIHARNSLMNMSNVGFEITLSEADPVIRLEHFQYFASNNTFRVDLYFTDNLTDANVYAALFSNVSSFPNTADVATFFENNLADTNIQKTFNAFNDYFTFVFDKYYDSSSSTWSAVSESNEYHFYVYAKENRANNPNTNVRACAYIGNFASSMVQGTELIDGRYASVNSFNQQYNASIDYVLFNMWVYLKSNTPAAVSERMLFENSDFKLYLTRSFGNMTYVNKYTSETLTFDVLIAHWVADAWNNVVIERNGDSINLFVNGGSDFKESTDSTYDATLIGVNGTGTLAIDQLLISTFKPFKTNPSFTRIAAADQTDVFAPSVFNTRTLPVNDVQINVQGLLMDQFGANIKVALIDTYYGSVEPYANLEANLVSFFNNDVINFYSVTSKHMMQTPFNLVTSNAYANVEDAVTRPSMANTESYHVYMQLTDDSVRRNSRVVYVSQTIGSDLFPDTPVVSDFTVLDGDSKARNISITLTETTNMKYAVAAFPADYKTSESAVVQQDFVRVYMNKNATFDIDVPSSIDTYYPSETDAPVSMAYAENYHVYTLVTNTITQEQTLSGPVMVFTAVAPIVQDLSVTVRDDFYIRVTGNVVEESTNITVYAAVFDDTIYNPEDLQNFFTNSEFNSISSTKLKQTSNVIDFMFDNFHTNIYFHDEVRSIISNVTEYNVVVYVKDNDHATYDTYFSSSNIEVRYIEDQEAPLIDVVNPLSMRDNSVSVSFTTSDNQNNIDVRVVVFANATTVSDYDARQFLRHANIDTIGFSQDNVSNVSTQFDDIPMSKAIDMSYISTEYTVATDLSGNVTLNSTLQPDIYLFKNRVYTFQVTGELPFYLSDNSNNALGGNPSIAYITTDNHEYNSIAEGLSNIAYVRFKVSSSDFTASEYRYGLWGISDVGGTIHVVDASDASQIPPVFTNDNTKDYRLFVYARDNSRRENNTITGITYRVGAPPIIRDLFAAFIIT